MRKKKEGKEDMMFELVFENGEEWKLAGAIGDKYYICFERLVCESVVHTVYK